MAKKQESNTEDQALNEEPSNTEDKIKEEPTSEPASKPKESTVYKNGKHKVTHKGVTKWMNDYQIRIALRSGDEIAFPKGSLATG